MAAQAQRIEPGRYPRGEETKQRIICSAIEIFGCEGFAGTSTRDIAGAACVNTPAIQYYFDGKLGLYNACIDHLTGMVSRRIAPAVEACERGFRSGVSIDETISLIGEMQNCLIDAFFSDFEGHAIRRLLAWEDAENDDDMSGRLMKDRIGLPVFKICRQAVERVTALPMTAIEVDLHALSLMGKSMIFHCNQGRVMDLMNWSVLDAGMLAQLKSVAGQQLIFALNGLAGTPQLSSRNLTGG